MPAIPPPTSRPEGPHLLDATMFWSREACGGVRRVISTKRAALVAEGWQHTLLAPGVRGPGMIDCGGMPLPFSGGYRFVWSRAHATRLIEQAEPEIIESSDPFTLAWATLDAARALQVPSVAFCHSNLPALARHWVAGVGGNHWRGRWAERQARHYLARVYAGFDMVLAPSRTMTEALHDLGVRHAHHQTLGVDSTVFNPAAADPAWRRALERRLQLPPGTRLLVYTGRFASEKNLDLLARAVELLGPKHVLLAVGNGPKPPKGRQVVVLKPQFHNGRLARLLASCDAFVHAGDQETFGLAALEAMACGTPLVASSAAGLGELADGVAITLASRRPGDWAEAMRTALAGREGALAQQALARARTLDWKLVLDGLSQRYLRLLQRGPLDNDEPSSAPTQPLLLQA
jgi:alpha-1,6-mannosyltransferase